MSPAYRNSLNLVRIRIALLAVLACALANSASTAAPCSFEAQGEGRVAAIIDARNLRLTDGREIKLAGIEPVSAEAARRTTALSAIVAGREIVLRANDDAPDRYGRQVAFVFVAGEDNSVQATLLAQGEALYAADTPDKDCAAALLASEAAGREAKKGIWAGPSATKNAESVGDIALCWWKAGFCRSGRPGQRLTSTSAATGHGISL